MAPRGLCARRGVVPSWSFKARATAKVRSALSRGRHNCAADLRAGGSLARRKAPGLGRRAASEKEPEGEPVEGSEDGFDEKDLLLEGEDWTVRGNSLNPNTPLGRAVSDACEELEDLAKLERQIQDETFAILEKLGVKRDDEVGKEQGEAEAE